MLDLSIAVDKLTTEQMHEVNKCALHYGLGRQDFMSLLTRDLDEQESLRIAKEEEQERAMYSVSNNPLEFVTTFFVCMSSIVCSMIHREEKQEKNGEPLENRNYRPC